MGQRHPVRCVHHDFTRLPGSTSDAPPDQGPGWHKREPGSFGPNTVARTTRINRLGNRESNPCLAAYHMGRHAMRFYGGIHIDRTTYLSPRGRRPTERDGRPSKQRWTPIDNDSDQADATRTLFSSRSLLTICVPFDEVPDGISSIDDRGGRGGRRLHRIEDDVPSLSLDYGEGQTAFTNWVDRSGECGIFAWARTITHTTILACDPLPQRAQVPRPATRSHPTSLSSVQGSFILRLQSWGVEQGNLTNRNGALK